MRETLERVMREKGFLKPDNQITINTPIGDFTYDAAKYSIVNNEEYNNTNTDKEEYYIRDDKNYAWDIPHKYDHRGNLAATVHNFMEINKEHPIQKPITTKSKIADFAIKQGLSKINPLISAGINAYNLGYQGAGYYDNWQRAKNAGKYPEYPTFQKDDFFLKK